MLPDWGNFWTDAAYWLNWTIYALPIVLLCMVGPALLAMIAVVSVMIGKQYRDEKPWREFDRLEKKSGKSIKP